MTTTKKTRAAEAKRAAAAWAAMWNEPAYKRIHAGKEAASKDALLAELYGSDDAERARARANRYLRAMYRFENLYLARLGFTA